MYFLFEFGLIYQEIEKVGIFIEDIIEILLLFDFEIGIFKFMGLGMIFFSEIYVRLKLDIFVILGDCFEVFLVVVVVMIVRILIVYIYGGEVIEGLIDEFIRYLIIKMVYLYFIVIEIYWYCVIQLGEQFDRVFNIGIFGFDNIDKLDFLFKEEFEKLINFKISYFIFLVIFYFVILDNNFFEN